MSEQKESSKSTSPKLPEGFSETIDLTRLLEDLRDYIWEQDDPEKIRRLTQVTRYLMEPPGEKDGFPPTRKG